ncbi:MAG: CgeB family protein [Myxococcota bacterium]
MKVVLFYHSALSDWNHGNAHFLRGVVSELCQRGHSVVVYEDEQAWSVVQLLRDHGSAALFAARDAYPELRVERYSLESLDLTAATDDADLVLVHEWNPPELIERIGRERAQGGSFCLLFHDTHHRAVSAPEELARYDLSAYDGILAFGEVLREIYQERGWGRRVFTWHEAADARLFQPLAHVEPRRDVVWIGNWGDDERTRELHAFLLEPIAKLGLSARVHGVRYPEAAKQALVSAGIEYAGWLPNFRVPQAFAEARLTLHVPRGFYTSVLRGIPTIRPFEALACGIPLVSAPWEDCESLFRVGEDFLMVENPEQMCRALCMLLHEPERARALAEKGRETLLARHTCAHRVDELLAIYERLTQRVALAQRNEWRRDGARI